ncbi:MAG: hypothetical protein HYY78_16040 [Betaproteobacteria bacterium]|nr:hypothetical protein [Betaproteobacteria bacterium]
MSARTYVWLVLALCAGFLAPVIGLNLQLSANSLGADRNRLASEWQQARRGVTYAPPISYNRPFKTLRLNDRIGEINTVVLGSSTTMGIVEDAFPPPLKSYNFAQSGNALRAMIGEAEYIVERWGASARLLVVPLDWALGFVFERGEPARAELSPQAVQREAAAARPSGLAQLTDALSAPRLKILAGIARDVLKAPSPAAAFRQVFLEPAGPEYRCADGTPARDFDVVYRGMCNGFRYDGSATFADQKRLDVGRAPGVLAAAVSGNGQYAAALRDGRGKPNPVLLERLARLARRAQAQGGTVLLLLPPLAPGVEEGLARAPHSAALLRATKDALTAWSVRERIPLLDAGRSEGYGCVAAEFVDPHHALPECYRKVLLRFFRDNPAVLTAGNR